MRFFRLVLFGACLSACGTSPKPSTPTVAKTRAVHEAPPTELPSDFRGQSSALTTKGILAELPDATMAAIAVPRLADFAKAVDWLPILQDYKSAFIGWNLKLSPSGARLVEPETWGALGLAPNAPVGAALLVESRIAGVFFATLADKSVFLENISHVSEALSLGAPQIQGAVIRFEKSEHLALVLRENALFLITTEAVKDLPAVIARLQDADTDTLGASGRLDISQGFDFGEDAAGFFAFDTFAKRIAQDQARQAGQTYWHRELEMHEERLEQAKTLGKPQEEISKLEKELADTRREFNRQTLREAGEAHVLQTLVGSLGTMVFGLDLEGATTRTRVRIANTPESFASRLFRNTPAPLALPGRLTEAPVFMLGAHVGRDAMLELLRTILNLEGETMRDFESMLRREIQLDFASWLDLIDGEVSGAITVDVKRLAASQSADEMLDAFGLHLLAETKDADAAAKFFEAAVQSPELAPLLNGNAKTPTLEVPGFGKRTIAISVQGNYFEAKTQSASDGPSPWKEHERALVTSSDTSGVFVFDPMLLQWLMVSEFSVAYDVQLAGKSEASQKQYEELRKKRETLGKKIAALRQERHRAVIRDFLKARDDFGRLTVALQTEPSGEHALVGSLVGDAANLGRAFQTLFEAIEPGAQKARTGTPSERSRLREEIWRLRQEYNQLDLIQP